MSHEREPVTKHFSGLILVLNELHGEGSVVEEAHGECLEDGGHVLYGTHFRLSVEFREESAYDVEFVLGQVVVALEVLKHDRYYLKSTYACDLVLVMHV